MAPKRISLKLSEEQQDEIRKVTGKNAEAIELSVEELEERIAPGKVQLGDISFMHYVDKASP